MFYENVDVDDFSNEKNDVSIMENPLEGMQFKKKNAPWHYLKEKSPTI